MPRTPDHLAIAAGPDVLYELEARRSRFLCVLRRVEDEAAARAFLAELRRAHHAARHHCSAFVIGPTRGLQRSNDDGEPSGTAGMPMLQALLGFAPDLDGAEVAAPLSDIAAVVVRYFGGTLLGAGGLTRAYSSAVVGALEQAEIVRREHWPLRRVTLTHGVAGRLEHELHATGVAVRNTDYVIDGICLTVAVPGGEEGSARFARWLAERQLTSADAGAEWIDVPLKR